LTQIKVYCRREWDRKPSSQEAFMTFIIAAVLFIFGTFAIALGYAQIQTRGMVAPGALPID